MKGDTVLKLKRGDLETFEDIYNDFFEKIYRFVFFKVNNQSKTEDICSEVFLRFVSFVKNNNVDNVSAILYKIARNLIIDDSKKNSEALIGDDNLETIKDDKDFSNLDEKYINNEFLFEALNKLSDDYRDIIVMYHVNEMNMKDISNVFGKTQGASKTMLSRAVNRLKEVMSSMDK